MSTDTLRSLADAMPLWSEILFVLIFSSVLFYAFTDRRSEHRAKMRSLALDDGTISNDTAPADTKQQGGAA